MGETADRLTQIFTSSAFPERGEALAFILDSIHEVGSLNQLNLSDPGSDLERAVVAGLIRYWIQDIQQSGHQSAFYLRFLDHFRGNG